ncbi:MAG TPA: KamA family radical SAM protein [Anaerohalosphaeraceae bacterium]|nr:KamA family radical SAM protein [Anaerohalosphaeraceae bacterium]
MKTNYITSLDDIVQLNHAQRNALANVTEHFDFRATDYYLSLIDWSDPNDPIRRLIIPSVEELDGTGQMDPSNEHAYTIMPGLEHKYHSTALLLVCDICAGICRYCFRKRLFLNPRQETLQDIAGAMDYIRSHPEITNVLLTGGDPLILSAGRLDKILYSLRDIEHVQIIRIGTRMAVFNPFRILNDPELLNVLAKHSTPEKRIYIMNHFSHPRELTAPAIHAIDQMLQSGIVLTNQCPLIRGVNDNPDTLAELWRKLSFIGAVPYYLFQCRPALGNSAYTVPIEEGYAIVEQARSKVSGLAKRARYVMSHATGKIEIIGLTEGEIFFRYHRAADDADSGRILVFKRNPDARWLDDYSNPILDYPAEKPAGLQEAD